MNKIRYILDLNNVRPAEADLASLRPALPEEPAPPKKRRIKPFVITAVVIAAAIAAAVFGAPALRRLIRRDQPDDTAAATAESGPAPAVFDGFTVTPLYAARERYDLFRRTALCTRVTADGTVVALPYLEGSMENALEDAIKSLRADGRRLIFAKDAAEYQKAEIRAAANTLTSMDPDAEILIIGSAKHGTFEYLLTLTVIKRGDTFYGEDGSTLLGTETPNGVRFRSGAFDDVLFGIYKIRFENDVPVIYYAAQTIADSRMSRLSVYDKSPEPVFSEYRYTLYDDPVSGELDTVIFGGKENDMSYAVTTLGHDADSYPLSYLPPRSAEERAQITDIINAFDLQWFLPAYSYADGDGTVLCGLAIECGPDYISGLGASVKYDIGAPGGDRAYYFKYLYSPIGLRYSPSYCGVPRLSDQIPDNVMMLCVILNGDGRITKSFAVPALNLLYADQTEAFRLTDLAYAGTFPAVTTFNVARPVSFHEYDLYGLTEPLSPGETTLFENLGLSVKQLPCAENGDEVEKNVSVKDIFTHGAATSSKAVYGKTEYVRTEFPAYEEHGIFLTDINGIICGVWSKSKAAVFNAGNVPSALMIVLSDGDGDVVYAGPEPNPAGTTGRFSFEKLECGVYVGEFQYSYENESSSAVISGIDEDGKVTISVYAKDYRDFIFVLNGFKTAVTKYGSLICTDPLNFHVIAYNEKDAEKIFLRYCGRDPSSGMPEMNAAEE